MSKRAGSTTFRTAERHGRARELFLVWMAPNIIYFDIILGGDMIKLGLGIWPAIGVIVVGNALLAVGGPRFGERVAIRNAGHRGHAGHVRRPRQSDQCGHCVWGIMVAYEAVNLSIGGLAGFAMIRALGIPLTLAWKLAMVLAVGIATITISIYGHATIVSLSGYFTVGLTLCFGVLAWFVLKHVNLHYSPPRFERGERLGLSHGGVGHHRIQSAVLADRRRLHPISSG